MRKLPKGFESFVDHDANRFEIRYRSDGTRLMQIFILICVALLGVPWTLFAVFAHERFLDLLMSEWWVPLALTGGLLAVVNFGWLAAFQAFGVTTIVATQQELQVVRTLGPMTFRRSMPARRIERFVQLKDGGIQGKWDYESDSFSSWGLVTQGKRRLGILSRQPYEKSEWLGGELAHWFGVPYVPTEPGD